VGRSSPSPFDETNCALDYDSPPCFAVILSSRWGKAGLRVDFRGSSFDGPSSSRGHFGWTTNQSGGAKNRYSQRSPSTSVGRAVQPLYLCPSQGDRRRKRSRDCSHDRLRDCHYTLPLPLFLTVGETLCQGDTTLRHEPGTGREQSRNTPLGG